MTGDRLDDAIDAVVRAVDRIERATREAGLEAQQLQARADETAEAAGRAGAGEPVADETAVEAAPTTTTGSPEPVADETTVTAAPQPAGAPVPAEVHELIGRIVGRTQVLEEHLDAARALRAEISELVARLAATATDRRAP